MPRYERKDIRPGMMMQLDCSVATPVTVKHSAPPRYGETSFAEVSRKLDEARKRLEEIARQVRRARGGK